MFVARSEGRVVGFVECYTPHFLSSQLGQAYPERVRAKLKPYLASLAVERSARRRGIAAALLTNVEEWAQQTGQRWLSLEVEASNAPAVALYSNAGYRITGRDENGRKLVPAAPIASSCPVC